MKKKRIRVPLNSSGDTMTLYVETDESGEWLTPEQVRQLTQRSDEMKYLHASNQLSARWFRTSKRVVLPVLTSEMR